MYKGSGVRQSDIPTAPLTQSCCVTLGKSLELSEHEFFFTEKREMRILVRRVDGRVKEDVVGKVWVSFAPQRMS